MTSSLVHALNALYSWLEAEADAESPDHRRRHRIHDAMISLEKAIKIISTLDSDPDLPNNVRLKYKGIMD